MIARLFIEVEPEQEATPFVEDPDTEPRQQGKQPPFDHIFHSCSFVNFLVLAALHTTKSWFSLGG
jgi:hypothetical protein